MEQKKIFHDGPIGYCAMQSKSDRGRQMPYDCMYMWNLKSKINKSSTTITTTTTTKQKQTHSYREHSEGYQMRGGWGSQ